MLPDKKGSPPTNLSFNSNQFVKFVIKLRSCFDLQCFACLVSWKSKHFSSFWKGVDSFQGAEEIFVIMLSIIQELGPLSLQICTSCKAHIKSTPRIVHMLYEEGMFKSQIWLKKSAL